MSSDANGDARRRGAAAAAADDVLKRANAIKAKANEAFKEHRFKSACELYTEAMDAIAREALNCESSNDAAAVAAAAAQAVQQQQQEHATGEDGGGSSSCAALLEPLWILYANRAFAHIKLEENGSAIQDATRSVVLSGNTYAKGYYRRGAARFALGRYKQALKDFKTVALMAPRDAGARAKLKECERRVRADAFAAAIDTSPDKSATPCMTLDMSSMTVDAHYDGPRVTPTAADGRGCVVAGDGSVTRAFCEELMEWYRAQRALPKKYVMQLVVAAHHYFVECATLVDVRIGDGTAHDADGDERGAARGNGVADNGETGRVDRDDVEEEVMVDEEEQRAAGVDARRDAASRPRLPTYRHITVCGDTHGQFFDLLNIFKLNGVPSVDKPYLFNGDFVDRGSWSVEVILTLLAFVVHDPRCMHLTRGNHESLSMNKIYGFEGEVRHKYSDVMFGLFEDLFRALPLGYVLHGEEQPSEALDTNNDNGGDGGDSGNRYSSPPPPPAAARHRRPRALVLHGGLFSRDHVTLDELRRLDRFREPDSGLMAEMLWSDPQKEDGWGESKRGIGVAFGPDVTRRFLDDNHLTLLVRSHEMKEDGYEVEADGRLITIFSAPNYCDQMGNRGAFITFDKALQPRFTQFDAVPHPSNVRPMMYASGAGMMGLG